jgi:sulfatase maturation enzyme AslB (radical SAM superfamily)
MITTMKNTMSKTYPVFPIKNDAACVYKWAWSTVRLYTGTSSSCHRVMPVKIDINNFDNFHNTPEVINDRVKMMNGEWPGRGCHYCKEYEESGGISDRIYHNDIPDLTPVDFTMDPTIPVTPRILEVYLHNTCDLSCLYCIPYYSSKVNAELKKFGPDVLGQQYIPIEDTRDSYYEKFFDWVTVNSDKLVRLSIMGGEPLLQKEFWLLLERLQTEKHPDLTISINSNLNCKQETIEKFVAIAYKLLKEKRVKRIDIGCSLDCWGEPAEYVRYGLDLTNWQRNFEYLIKHKWLYLTVHHVVTGLTLGTALDMQRKLAEYKTVNTAIVQAYHLVDGPVTEIYHPAIFGPDFFKEDLTNLMNEYPITQEWDNTAKTRLEGIVKIIQSSTIDVSKLKKLKESLDMNDSRKGVDWKSVFPKINQFFNEHNI